MHRLHFLNDLRTTALCIAAIEKNGMALSWDKDTTPEMCLAAIKQHGREAETPEDKYERNHRREIEESPEDR
jgi:hypothetical protein